jgi:DNA-binding NarL/FixJ family response regulator
MLDASAMADPGAGAEPICDTTVSLVVIEDNRLLREGLCELLQRQPGFDVLAAAPDSAVLARFMPPTSPVVLLLDVGLRDDDSVQICADVRSRFPTVRVIVMGMAPQHDDIAGFVHAGAVGFIRKDATTEEFIATIRHVADGASALPRALTESLFAEIVRQPTQLPKQVIEDGTRLTTREREIVDLLGEGLSNKEIAARLHIAIHTVKSHVHNVLEKLALHSRLEVVAYSRTPKGHR